MKEELDCRFSGSALLHTQDEARGYIDLPQCSTSRELHRCRVSFQASWLEAPFARTIYPPRTEDVVRSLHSSMDRLASIGFNYQMSRIAADPGAGAMGIGLFHFPPLN
jgi:hypothetical protein